MRKSQGEDQTNTGRGGARGHPEEAGMSANATGLVCTAADGYACEMTMEDLKDGIIALKMGWRMDRREDASNRYASCCPTSQPTLISQLAEISVVENHPAPRKGGRRFSGENPPTIFFVSVPSPRGTRISAGWCHGALTPAHGMHAVVSR